MPKTKLDKYSKRQLSKSEKDAIIVRCAFIKRGIIKQRDMAKAIGADEATFSRWLSKGFTPNAVARIHSFVDFSPEELEALLCR